MLHVFSFHAACFLKLIITLFPIFYGKKGAGGQAWMSLVVLLVGTGVVFTEACLKQGV